MMKSYDELLVERNALSARVDFLQSSIDKYQALGDESILREALNKNSQRRLAEICADAIHDAIEYATENYGEVLISELVEYADKLRQGGE